MTNEKQEITLTEDFVTSKIYFIRNKRVMLDKDLADLYEVETRALNQAVSRNKERFPELFMFQLTEFEFEILISQFVISSWGGKDNNFYKNSFQSRPPVTHARLKRAILAPPSLS